MAALNECARKAQRLASHLGLDLDKDVNATYYFVYLRSENSREKRTGKSFMLFIGLWVELC